MTERTVPCPSCGQPTTVLRMPLTPRQREMFDFCVKYEAQRHVFPSFSEIAQGLGLRSQATVDEHLRTLVRKGWVVRVGGFATARPFATTAAAWGQP